MLPALRTKLLPWIEGFLILLVLFAIFANRAQIVKIHPDEREWIATSDVFEAFIHADFDSIVFSEHHWTLTQPQVTRYLIAIGRKMGGYTVDDLQVNPLYHTDRAEYILDPPTPAPRLLFWSRLPMIILAALAGLGLTYVLRLFGGYICAYVLLVLYCANPYLWKILPTAMSEAPLLLMVALAMSSGIFALTGWASVAARDEVDARSLRKPFGWFLVLGIIVGAAASIKLNGAVLLVPAVLLAALAVWKCPGNVSLEMRRLFFVRTSLAIIFSSMLVFIALNPFLYPDPIIRSGRMLKYRLVEMQFQQKIYSEDRVGDSPADRVTVIGQRVFQDYSSLRFPGAWAVNGALTAAGLALLARSAKNWGRDPSLKNAVGASVLIVGVVVSLPSLATPLDWDRYYLLPVLLSSIGIAVAVNAGLRLLLRVTVARRTDRSGWVHRWLAR